MAKKNTKSVMLYDDALPAFTRIILSKMGDAGLLANCFLRDADGNLTFIVRDRPVAEARMLLSDAVRNSLGTYISGEPICSPEELFDEQLRDKDQDRLEYVSESEVFVRLVERRIVGQDWLRGIWPQIEGVPPVVVFASHKGGVGRSTALAVAAANFAQRGYSVLAIDTDLEAPGLGEIFVAPQKQPTFGALDYFVENGRGTVDASFLRQMLARAKLPKSSGSVSIVPAVGTKCHDFPQNVIGKISRAYLEDLSPDGSKQLTLLEQLRGLIKDLCTQSRYDLIFVDARAGLNETTAATVQGLGADILFFGVDTPQTWDGYRYFLAHLARFKPASSDADWRLRLKMVHAKALTNPSSLAAFRDRAFELFAEHLYDELDEAADSDQIPFGFDLDDRSAPHFPWVIGVDAKYHEFDPLTNPKLLLPTNYKETFGSFITNLAERVGL